MKKFVFMLIIAMFILSGGFGRAEESSGELTFHVIVHDSNPVTALKAKDISRLFLKKTKTWEETDEKVLPVDLVEDSPVREAFSEIIHKKAVSSVKAYWQKQVFSGRGVPPEEKKTQEDVLEYVSEHKGAIGYVPAEAALDDYDVKVLDIEQ